MSKQSKGLANDAKNIAEKGNKSYIKHTKYNKCVLSIIKGVIRAVQIFRDNYM